jgi:site-specific DNA-methyltransferase (adenine-specific)/modification methylase
MREEIIGNQRLILGDAYEIAPTIMADAIVTDPPYGIKITNSDRLKIDNDRNTWDDYPAKVEFILNRNLPTVIWGGNYFGLPASRGFLILDKNNSGRDFADCEMAWTNQNKNARMMTLRPMNMDGGKVHPTQKPVAIMEWTINYLPYSQTILDPFMGSATTLVSCHRLGRHGIGIEKEMKYFDIACKRVEDAVKQPRLFEPTPQKIVQEKMF